jgi:hypothetical protein
MVVDDDDGSEVLKCFGVDVSALRCEMDGRASVGKHSDTRTGGERASSMRAILKYCIYLRSRSPGRALANGQRSIHSLFRFLLCHHLLLVSRYQSDMV